MGDRQQITIADAEVLGVSGGVDDAIGQPVVVLTLRPISGSGWRHVNYALGVENARSLLERLNFLLALPNDVLRSIWHSH